VEQTGGVVFTGPDRQRADQLISDSSRDDPAATPQVLQSAQPGVALVEILIVDQTVPFFWGEIGDTGRHF
jgi:hypothetical protein